MGNTEELLEFFTKKKKLVDIHTGEVRYSGTFDTFKIDFDLLNKFLPEVPTKNGRISFSDAFISIDGKVFTDKDAKIEVIYDV